MTKKKSLLFIAVAFVVASFGYTESDKKASEIKKIKVLKSKSIKNNKTAENKKEKKDRTVAKPKVNDSKNAAVSKKDAQKKKSDEKLAAKKKPNVGAKNGGGSYDPKTMWGVPVFTKNKKLLYVKENPLQTHERKGCAILKVRGFESRAKNNKKGRIRVAVWDRAEIYGKEGIKPFRASSHYVKDASGNEIRFKICGLKKGKSYSFFAHFDEENVGKIRRNFLGIPKDLYVFSDAKSKDKGIKRVGLSAPPFNRTIRPFKKENQDIILPF